MEKKFVGIEEKVLVPKSGFLMLILSITGIPVIIGIFIAAIFQLENDIYLLGLPLLFSSIVLMIMLLVNLSGLKTVKPNEVMVLTLFGKYLGTVKRSGFYYVNPFSLAMSDKNLDGYFTETEKEGSSESKTNVIGLKKRISLKMRSLNNNKQKVNDLLGNPIVIETVVIWRVDNATKAVFNVENYSVYLETQCDSIVRNIVRLYPYDNLEYDNFEDSELTLMGSSQKIADQMREELQDKVAEAGLYIEEVRISHLSYAEEIAAAMLQRQQASAIVAAREKIVEGAVGMVEMALTELDKKEMVLLDDERKAQMVSNLLVVLCGNKDAQPIVNSGSLY